MTFSSFASGPFPVRAAMAVTVALNLGLVLAGCASEPTAAVSDGGPRRNAGRIAFTDGLVSDYQLTPVAREHLQYYLSQPVTLVRSVSEGERGISQGRLVGRSGRMVHEVVVPAGTPGIAIGAGPNWTAVSFYPGTYLYFVSDQPNASGYYGTMQRTQGHYSLYAPDWDGRSGTVPFAGKPYQAIEGSMSAYLLVDRSQLDYTTGSRSTLPGRWLDGQPRPPVRY